MYVCMGLLIDKTNAILQGLFSIIAKNEKEHLSKAFKYHDILYV